MLGKIIIVDDGSSSPVYRLSENEDAIHVLRHNKTLGPGKAFGTGFSYLSSFIEPHDWVITMEGDGTSRPSFINELLCRSKEGYEVVLASPYSYGGGFSNASLIRRIMSELGSLYARFFLGIRGIWTVSCFYRLYRGSEILRLQRIYGATIISCFGFEGVVELLEKSARAYVPISEVPYRVEGSSPLRKSRMKVISTIKGYLHLTLVRKVTRQPRL